MKVSRFIASLLLTGIGLTLSHGPVHAQVLIDQAKAMSGGAIAGDTAGFPVIITQSGSYKLASNLTVPANTVAIQVTAPDVTLDLNGFTISGPASCTLDSTAGVLCNVAAQPNGLPLVLAAADRTVIRNGTLKGSTGMGLVLTGGGHTLSDLTVTQTAGIGIKRNQACGKGVRTMLNQVQVNTTMGDAIYGCEMQIDRARIIGTNGSALNVPDNVMSVNIIDSVMSQIRNRVVTGSGNSKVALARNVTVDNFISNDPGGMQFTGVILVNGVPFSY